jgi:hypothetical protein
MMTPMNLRDLLRPGDALVTGICWYSAEQWARLREVAADRGELEQTHEEWLTMMKRELRRFREAGIPYQLVDIEVEELVRWCKRKRIPINSSSRAEYAAHLLQQRRERS